MKSSLLACFAAILFACFATPANAEESPKNFTLHLGFGPHSINAIDDELDSSTGTKPVSDVFGTGPKLMFQMGLEYYVWQGFGSVGIEGASGFWHTSGKGLREDGTQSKDSTTFNMIPLKLSAVYRFSYLQEEWAVPLVPFAKFGFDYWIWWVLNQRDDLARFVDDDGSSSKALGATYGLHVAYGLMFNLNFIDRELGRDFDQSAGVNGTYLYIEGVYNWLEDFKIGDSWNLSTHTFLAGILFEF